MEPTCNSILVARRILAGRKRRGGETYHGFCTDGHQCSGHSQCEEGHPDTQLWFFFFFRFYERISLSVLSAHARGYSCPHLGNAPFCIASSNFNPPLLTFLAWFVVHFRMRF